VNPLWHPFADMGAVAADKLVLARGEDIWVEDVDGNTYLDATASLWCANVGHGRPEIAEAVAKQLRRLDTYSIFGDYANPPALELATRLAELSPLDDTKVFLGSGGGDMLDTAAKIARAHFVQTGNPQRTHLISRRLGYHGTHGLGTSLGGIEANVSGWGRMVPDVSVVDADSPEALEQEILAVGPDRVAAFFCEPVIGAGGVHLPREGYLEAVADICRQYGVLFVADCVICGFGRLGTWFGIERWPVVPDMITLAKGITGGTMPLGALLVGGSVAAPYFTGEPGAPVLRHGPTYAGHPACCAAALATLDIYEREELIPRGRDLEGDLAAALESLEPNPLVGEVRAGLGLLAGVDLAPEVLSAVPGATARLQRACRDEGVLVRPLLRGLAVSPPLTITAAELADLGARVGAGLERFAAATSDEVAA
jgi:adenosylmethionine-8-amino-7-oxononanoate aminotransferase